VPMPETAVNEYDGLTARKYQIRFTRQVASMKAIPETPGVKATTNEHFGRGVFPPNARHHPASGGGVDDISQRAATAPDGLDR